MEDILPLWRCIRIDVGSESGTDVDGPTTNASGASAEISAGHRVYGEVQQAAKTLLTNSQTTGSILCCEMQVTDLRQPSAEDLAGSVGSQPATVVYVYTDRLSLTSNEVPQLQSKDLSSKHVLLLNLSCAA